MAHTKNTRPRKTRKQKGRQYKIRNWPQYTSALRNRGSITLWMDEEAKGSWLYRGSQQQGHPLIYSDVAIQCCLTVREVFHLRYRQSQGFVCSVFALMKIDLPVPDYTTLCRRAGDPDVDLAQKISLGDHLDVVIDSTGLKVYGEGEWKVRMHGFGKHRTWRKLHLAVDPESGEIEAMELTTNGKDDAEEVAPLLEKIDATIDRAAMDGTYDRRKVYDALQKRAIQPLIPPQKKAKIWQHGRSSSPPHLRDENLRRIRAIGRKKWKQECGYHERSLAETAMYRQKIIFGGFLKNRLMHTQKTEAAIRCRALNIMTHLGMPDGQWVTVS